MARRIDDDQVYATVCRLLVETGYDGLTTKVLAERTGINEVSLFRRYDSKAKLICNAVNHTLSSVTLAGLSYGGDLRRDLVAIVGACIETVREHGPLLPVLMIELRRHPELSGAMDMIGANVRSMVEILERYLLDGKLAGTGGMELLGVLLGPLLMQAWNPFDADPSRSKSPDAQFYVQRFLPGYGVE